MSADRPAPVTAPAEAPALPAVHCCGCLPAEGAFARPLHLAIGMFDGVHLGHQAVIRQAVAAARAAEDGHGSGVLTFDPHPSRVLCPERATPLLMPTELRVARMCALGVDHVFVQAFTRTYARIPAEGFVAALRATFPQLRSLHVGENFRFGAGRAGDAATLRRCAEALGIEARVLPRESLGGAPISSSRVRDALAAGDIRAANAMLGAPYLVAGRVVAGNQYGRQWGVPTLNIPWQPEAAPRFGVYRVLLRAGAGPAQPGLANYGLRPTVGAAPAPLLEVHLLDPVEVPGPGQPVRVALLDFLRPERQFPSTEDLRRQIAADIAAARAAWAAEPPPSSGAFE